ncbi:hypothetical protein ACKWTF_016549 [Chironomus riparius]
MEAIRHNAIQYNSKRSGITALLKELKPNFPLIPSDFRSFLATPRTTPLKQIAPGKALDFSIREEIIRILEKQTPTTNDICIDLFVDGVQFKKNTKEKAFYVILGRALGEIFEISVYNGPKQPDSFNQFLKECIVEMKEMMNG